MAKDHSTLTDKGIAALPVGSDLAIDKEGAPGYKVRVGKTGATLYTLNSLPGTNTIIRMNIGPHGYGKYKKPHEVTKAQGYAEWARRYGLLRQGTDFRSVDNPEEATAEPPQKQSEDVAEPLLKDLINTYTQACRTGIGVRRKLASQTIKEMERALERELDTFLKKPVHEFSRQEAKAVLNALLERDARVMHNRLGAYGRAMYNWAIRAEWPADNPLEINPFWQFVKVEEIARDRTLSVKELKVVLKKLKKSLLSPDQQDVLLFCLLTGCRISEASEATWTEIHDDEWHLSGEKQRTKNRRNHIVYLSPMALEILERHEGGKCIFSRFSKKKNSHKEVGYIRADGIQNNLRESMEIFGTEPWTPHDLRRTFGTWCGDQGIPRQVHDRLLNHFQKSVGSTYDRASYNEPARKAWMQWGEYIQSLMSEEG